MFLLFGWARFYSCCALTIMRRPHRKTNQLFNMSDPASFRGISIVFADILLNLRIGSQTFPPQLTKIPLLET